MLLLLIFLADNAVAVIGKKCLFIAAEWECNELFYWNYYCAASALKKAEPQNVSNRQSGLGSGLPEEAHTQPGTMKFTIILALTAFVVATTAADSAEMPEKFLGKWEVEKSDNFDEYLEAKGYGWFMRQMVKLASITKVFTKKGDNPPVYNCKIMTTKKDVEWDNFKMDEEFQGEYLDESQHKIKFSYDAAADKLIEKHAKVENGEIDVYEYTIENGYMVMRMEYNGVSTKRYYKKTE
ncbi:fatty acid-binding protein like protein [Ditylenchus destructor]|nr:fatty acid-binding protein like protein [Ditylenchus destructor]